MCIKIPLAVVLRREKRSETETTNPIGSYRGDGGLSSSGAVDVAKHASFVWTQLTGLAGRRDERSERKTGVRNKIWEALLFVLPLALYFVRRTTNGSLKK